MNQQEKLVVLTAMQKVIKAEIDRTREEVEEELRPIFADGGSKKVAIGSAKASIGFTMNAPKFTAYEDEPEFMEFMRAHGMTREVVDPAWKKVVTSAGGCVIWEETGEEVPHAYFEPESYKAMTVRVSKPSEVIEQAQLTGFDFKALGGGQ